MVSIARRITAWSEGEIRRVLRRSRRVIRSADADVSVAGSSDEFGRILIIIPKKVGTAVVRNRIRRRIRSLFFEKKFFTQRLLWIVYVKPPLAEQSFTQLEQLFTQWAERIREYGQSLRSKSSAPSSEQSEAADSPQAVPTTRQQ